MKQSKTIVFIHGLFQNPKAWEYWVPYFQNLGYTCHTFVYPFHEGDPAKLRANPDPQLGKVTLSGVFDKLVSFVDALPEKPILIGHSMGGLLVQKLIGMDKGICGIAIDSAAPKGVLSFKWSFLKASFPVITPFKGNSIFFPTLKWCQYAFLNTLSLAEAKPVFDKYFVPEGRNIARSSLGKAGFVDFKKAHAPLLFIAGEKDNIIPSSLNRKNFLAYKDPNSKRDFHEFPGRTHNICGQKNWEEVAGFISTWIQATFANR